MSKDNRKQMAQQAFLDFFNQFGSTPDLHTTIVLEEFFKKLYEGHNVINSSSTKDTYGKY